MTETTRFVSKPTGVVIVALFIAVWVLGMYWAHDRNSAEENRSCMDGLVRPQENEEDYAEKELAWASDVRGCMRG